MVQSVDVTFDMEVKSSVSSQRTSDKSGTLDATAKLGWGAFSLDVTIKGSISSHESNTRSSDNSAKYHVSVQARQAGTPEGLSRVLDILSSAVQPSAITPDSSTKSSVSKPVIEAPAVPRNALSSSAARG